MQQKTKPLAFAVFVVIALVGVVITLVFIRFGPGVSGDSVTYVMGAENIAAGKGYSRINGGGEIEFITGFPPMYSLLLVPIVELGSNPYQLAGYLNVFIMGLNVFLVMVLIHSVTENIWPALAAGLLAITSDSMVITHGWLFSEPLYITLLLCSTLTLRRYLIRHEIRQIILLGLLTATASLTRYTGVVLLGVVVSLVLFHKPLSLREKATGLSAYIAFSIIPLVAWFVRNQVHAGTAVNRVLEFRMMRRELAVQYLAEISSWFTPGLIPLGEIIRAGISIMIAGGLLFYFLIWSFKQLSEKSGDSIIGQTSILWISLLMMVGHVMVLLANSFLLDAATTSSAPPRYLLPVYVFTLIFYCSLGYKVVSNVNLGRAVPAIAIGYVLITATLQSVPLVEKIDEAIIYNGYTGFSLRNPRVAESVRDIEPDTTIISNNPELIYYLSGRTAYMRPIKFDPYQQEPRVDYDDQVQFVQSLLNAGAVFVQLKPPGSEIEAIIDDLEMELIFSHALDGYFYRATE